MKVLLLLAFLQGYPYETLDRLSVGVNLVARTNITIGSDTFNSCMKDQAAAGNLAAWTGNIWFEPWPSTLFKVTVWYPDGSFADVIAGGTPSSTGFKATNMGVTGEDFVGQGGDLKANGTPDQHFYLEGMKQAPVKIQVLGFEQNGIWEQPYNGNNWVIYSQFKPPASNVAGYCDGRAQYEMIKDCVTRHNAFWNEQNTGKIRSQSALNNRLTFYKLEYVNVMDDFSGSK